MRNKVMLKLKLRIDPKTLIINAPWSYKRELKKKGKMIYSVKE